jgi:hypothetical protein
MPLFKHIPLCDEDCLAYPLILTASLDPLILTASLRAYGFLCT